LAKSSVYFYGTIGVNVGLTLASFGAGSVLGAARVSTLAGAYRLARTGTAIQRASVALAAYDAVGTGVA